MEVAVHCDLDCARTQSRSRNAQRIVYIACIVTVEILIYLIVGFSNTLCTPEEPSPRQLSHIFLQLLHVIYRIGVVLCGCGGAVARGDYHSAPAPARASRGIIIRTHAVGFAYLVE